MVDAKMWRLDVRQQSSFTNAAGDFVNRFVLADGRTVERTITSAALRSGKLQGDTIRNWLLDELWKVYRRCVDHEDCARLRALGEACWESTCGHLGLPSPGSLNESKEEER